MTSNLFNKKYAIITHKLFSGAGQELYRFLKTHDSEQILLIEHTFSSSPNRKTIITQYSQSIEKIEESFDYKKFPDSLVYLKDFVLGFFIVLLKPVTFDLIVGCGGFNALCALLLKMIGRTDKVVFYTIDYVPKRFDNYILNKIYHLIDKFCVKHCDQIWNLSPRMAEGREYYNNMPISKYSKQKVVPIGIWLDDVPPNNRKFEKKSIIFLGHLIEKQGVQLILIALPKIIIEIPDIQFIVLGTGDYENELKVLVNKLNINQYVKFCGALYNPHNIYNILSKSHVGVAMYNKEIDTFTYFSDPTKLKTYLSAGLPVLLSDVPYNAKEIENYKCGIIIDYDVNSIANSIINLFSDMNDLSIYSMNARKYAEKYDWNTIFLNALDVF